MAPGQRDPGSRMRACSWTGSGVPGGCSGRELILIWMMSQPVLPAPGHYKLFNKNNMVGEEGLEPSKS
jgi:hypothetical protein